MKYAILLLLLSFTFQTSTKIWEEKWDSENMITPKSIMIKNLKTGKTLYGRTRIFRSKTGLAFQVLKSGMIPQNIKEMLLKLNECSLDNLNQDHCKYSLELEKKPKDILLSIQGNKHGPGFSLNIFKLEQRKDNKIRFLTSIHLAFELIYREDFETKFFKPLLEVFPFLNDSRQSIITTLLESASALSKQYDWLSKTSEIPGEMYGNESKTEEEMWQLISPMLAQSNYKYNVIINGFVYIEQRLVTKLVNDSLKKFNLGEIWYDTLFEFIMNHASFKTLFSLLEKEAKKRKDLFPRDFNLEILRRLLSWVIEIKIMNRYIFTRMEFRLYEANIDQTIIGEFEKTYSSFEREYEELYFLSTVIFEPPNRWSFEYELNIWMKLVNLENYLKTLIIPKTMVEQA
jgi:hypothetical protein